MRAARLACLLASASSACGPAPAASGPAPLATPQPSASVAPEEAQDPVVPIEQLLADGAEKRFLRRARIGPSTPLRWVPDAAAEVASTCREHDHELVVAEAGPRFVRIVQQGTSLRLAAYVQPRDLRRVVKERVTAAPFNGALREAAIVLLPGAAPEWKRDRRGAGSDRELAFSLRGDWELDGWVVERALGAVFTPNDGGPPRHRVVGASHLLDAPGGAPLVKLELEGVAAEAVGAPRDGFQRVAVTQKHVRLEGWVAAGKVSVTEPAGRLGGGYGAGLGGSRTLVLAAGTKLHAAARGPQIGVLLRDSRVGVAEGREAGRGLARIPVYACGQANVWVDDAALEDAKRRAELAAKRRARVKVLSASISGGYQDPTTTFEGLAEDVAICAEKAEAGAKQPLAGKLVLKLSVDAGGSTTAVEASGALARDAVFKTCVEAVRPYVWTLDGATPQSGVAFGTLELAKS